MDNSDSEFVQHVPCPTCNSSDNASLYSDGHVYCHVCKYYKHNDSERRVKVSNPALIPDIEYRDIQKRKLTAETCRKFGYGISGGLHVATYYDEEGNPVAQKTRTADKEFRVRGNLDKAVLFGQQLWRDGGKMVIVTEGEIDAMSVSQVQGNKWPVVSIPTGSGGAYKALQKQLEWLEKFESVILMFDNDEPGRKAASECVELFQPGKAKIATLPLKDASDMLQAGKSGEIINAIWGAKTHRPDGILSGSDLWERISTRKRVEAKLFPFEGLNALTEGARRGELIMLTAGSGMGKSEFAGQVFYDWMQKGEVIGLLHLEENIERSCDRMIGLHLNKRVHLDSVRPSVEPAQLKAAYDATVGSGRMFLYDHFGSTDDANLLAKIRYLAKGCGCTSILLDHISIVVSGMEGSDERKLIDSMMTKMASLAQELSIRILVISHLRKADGTPHEEGGRVFLDDLRGSGSLKQLSFTVIALERNQQDAMTKMWTRVRVLKCRHTGQTGHACWLQYDPITGWLKEGSPPFSDDESNTVLFKDETKPKETAHESVHQDF